MDFQSFRGRIYNKQLPLSHHGVQEARWCGAGVNSYYFKNFFLLGFRESGMARNKLLIMSVFVSD